MRYSPSDKTEIIRLVEQSPWPARGTLEKLGIPRSSFYRWYDRYQRGGPEALADRPSRADRIWNRIPEAIRRQIVDLALDCQIALNRLPVFALKASPPLVTGSDAPEPPRRSWVGLRSRGGSGFRRALRVDALKPGS